MEKSKRGLLFFAILPLVMVTPLLLLGHVKIKYLFGELAYCLFILDAILGYRPAMIERQIDLKKLYMIHGLMAVFAVIFSTWHDLMSHLHGIASLFGQIALYSSIVVTCLALIFLSSQLLSLIPGAGLIVDLIRKIAQAFKIDRELNLLLHVLTPFIVILVFLHVILISKFNGRFWFMLIFVSYFLIFAGLSLYYGVIAKLIVPKYQVKALKLMGNDTYELVLEYSWGRCPVIKSGQFVFIKAPFAKLGEYHPFSVVSSENNGRVITLGIKVVGDFTQKLEQIELGTTIKLKGVFGHFSLPNNGEPILMIAGGIGITPCIGLLNLLPVDRKAYLIWSLHSKNTSAFGEELRQLRATHPNLRIHIHDSSAEGHLSEQELIAKVPELREGQGLNCFLCGPKLMTNNLQKILMKQGVAKKSILVKGFIF